MKTVWLGLIGEPGAWLSNYVQTLIWLMQFPIKSLAMFDQFAKIVLFSLLNLGVFVSQAQSATAIIGYYQSTIVNNGTTVLANSPMEACIEAIATFKPFYSSYTPVVHTWTAIPGVGNKNLTKDGGTPGIDPVSGLPMLLYSCLIYNGNEYVSGTGWMYPVCPTSYSVSYPYGICPIKDDSPNPANPPKNNDPPSCKKGTPGVGNPINPYKCRFFLPSAYRRISFPVDFRQLRPCLWSS